MLPCNAKRFIQITSLSLLMGCFSSSSDDVATNNLPIPKVVESERTDPWVLIDSASDRLTVFRKDESPIVFQNVAFGAAGVKDKLHSGDDITPRGSYTVGWIRHQSKFTTFIGLTYPSLVDAKRGYQRGVINYATFEKIKSSHEQGAVPPQNTPLGGFIGIHGVGRGSVEIHRLANWTAGCIALENDQIEELSRLVHPGTQVEIR